jgi:aminomethyltransferase
MAYLEPAVAVVGTTLDIDIRGTSVSAAIVPLPFYKKTSSL